MNENTAKILNWDTEFFKKKIASVSMNTWDEAFLDKSLQQFKKEEVRLVYLFLEDGLVLPDSYLLKFKFNLVDKKRIYILSKVQDSEILPNIVVYAGNASALYDLAIQAGIDSRYRVDPDFPNEDFERLYKAWIDNSLTGGMADYVLTYRMPSGKLGGFITLKKRSESLSIGLVATDISCRRMGIGKALMNAAKHYAYVNRLGLEVTTQADNVPACSFYENNGFVMQSQTTVYHIWL